MRRIATLPEFPDPRFFATMHRVSKDIQDPDYKKWMDQMRYSLVLRDLLVAAYKKEGRWVGGELNMGWIT